MSIGSNQLGTKYANHKLSWELIDKFLPNHIQNYILGEKLKKNFYSFFDVTNEHPEALQYQKGFKKEFGKLIADIYKYGTISPQGKMCNTPDKIFIKLKTHQRRTLYEMIQREKSKYRFIDGMNINFLCDNVGSGKSLCVLSLIAAEPKAQLSSQNFYSESNKQSSTGYYSYFKSGYDLKTGLIIDKNAIEFKANLIIVPHNVFNQWKNYIHV